MIAMRSGTRRVGPDQAGGLVTCHKGDNVLRVGVIAEDQLECSGIRATLADQAGVSVVAEGKPGGELRLVRHTPLDVLVNCQPSADAALHSLRRVTAGSPRRPCTLILLNCPTAEDIRRLLACHSVGILRRGTAATHLPWAVPAAAHGGLVLDPGLTRSVVAAYTEPERLTTARKAAQMLIGTLSPREREVLDLAAEGLTSAGIAASLSVAEVTVKAHLRNIYTRLGVSNRMQAVRVAWEAGQPAVAPARRHVRVSAATSPRLMTEGIQPAT